MPITVPPFTTTASITGSTLISNADNQLNILMNDVETYVETTYQTVATNLEGTVGIHVTTASNFASQAQASATSALNSANNADISKANALSYKNLAQTAASNASTSEANALSYKNLAQASADSAATSAYDASVNATTVANHLNNTVNPHNVTASQVGLGNVTNTSDYAKPVLGFTLDNTISPNIGQLAWNQAENTLDLGLNGATLQVGQEQLIRVRNTTASTITNGTAVMATGTIGASGRITVAPANINSSNIKFILGIVTENIAAGADGFVTNFGKVRGIDTTGSVSGETWLDGDVLYVKDSGNGALTKAVPTETQVKLPVAIVIHSHGSNGSLFVRVNSIDENAVANRANKLTAARSITLTGDVTGTLNFDGSTNVSMSTTIVANSVTLGTDTTGNYVAGNTAGTGITISGTAGEGWSPTIAITNVGTAGTYTKVTTNAQGQVIAGTTLSATDIPALDASKVTSGIIDAARLPSYVDDVLEFTNLAGFPATGETGKIYLALDTKKTYRWSGSVYIYITSGAVDSVTLVKGDVGLGNVDNTNDASKPVSTAQQTALDLKANIASPTFIGVPAVPTADVGTNTTQVASTAYVIAEINKIEEW